MIHPLLTSAQNPKIKSVLTLLEKPKERRDTSLFAVEGIREVSLALTSGYTPRALFYLPQALPDPHRNLPLPPQLPCYPVTPELYKKIAYRDTTEGVVAIMAQKSLRLHDLSLAPDPLILVAESVEKPGNIGAMLRTADAAQVDAVFICDPSCDLYNPNLIRASLGALFTQQVVACTTPEAIEWLQQHRIRIYTATLQDATPYHGHDYRSGCAIVVGSESRGLSPVWKSASHAAIKIPMRGAVDSLNVSVSAAILIFEAIRQRMDVQM